ncbi:MAG: hypothetical protein RIR48_2855 [Bacteroidota bacterium]
MQIGFIEDGRNISVLSKNVLSVLQLPTDMYNNRWQGLDGIMNKSYQFLDLIFSMNSL